MPNHPSWVPDFTQPLPWKTFQSTGDTMRFKAASELQTQLWLDCFKEKTVGFNASPIDSVERTCNAYWTKDNGKDLAAFLKLLFHPSGPARTYDEDRASTMLRLMVADGFKNTRALIRAATLLNSLNVGSLAVSSPAMRSTTGSQTLQLHSGATPRPRPPLWPKRLA